MSGRERCNGPGHKLIFNTKAEAQAFLEDSGRRFAGRPGAKLGQGGVRSCTWAFGAHYHITSKRRKRGK